MKKQLNNLDAIICTYNRPEIVAGLVQNILECEPLPTKIIVVDSSDTINTELANNEKVEYVRSDRKCQPYQRFLGSKKAISKYVLFFDDDVKILIPTIFQKVVNGFESNQELVGISMGIHYENGIQMNQTSKISNLENTGKISWLGKTTGLPKKDMEVDYFPGPIMVFKKIILDKLFDEYMFKIFELKIAIPEDKAISMRASKYGKLFYFGKENYLYHPPIPSTYYQDDIKFIAKTTFSRLWISKIYADVKNKNILFAYIFFYIYIIKQLLVGIFKIDKNLLKGNILAIKYFFKY